LDGASLQARRQAASLQLGLASAPGEPLDEPVVSPAWQQPGLAQVKSLRAPLVEPPPALESQQAELRQRALPRPRRPGAPQGGSARKQLEREALEPRQEAAEEPPQRASCEPLGRPLLSPLCQLRPSVRLPLPLRRRRESARAPLPRLLHRSNWNASFSR